MDLQIDVTEKLRELTRGGRAEGLVATIVFSPSDSAERAAPLVFSRSVNFAKASLVVRTQSRRPRALPLRVRR